jgi:large subunit ribosomal protein L4
MYRGAIRSMLSELIRQERLLVTDEFTVEAPKTKQLKLKLKELGTDNVLIVVEGFDEKLWLAARNLPGVEILEARSVDPVSLARHDRVIMTVAAVKLVEERLA